ncbi:MAG: sulfatase-like hydrolase/transferase [Polyangiaceae bacterium]
MPLSSPAQRDTRALNFPGLLARLVSAGVFSAWCMVGGDAWVRSGWPYFSVKHHLAAALGLFAAVGALLGLLTSCLVWLEWRLIGRRVAASWGAAARRSVAIRPAFYGLVGGLASASTAIATFSGEHVSRTRAATLGPVLFMACAGAVSALGAALIIRALGRMTMTRRGRSCAPYVASFFVLGAGLVWIDLTQYVSVYVRLHTILELSAALILGAALALILEALIRHFRRGEALIRTLGAFGCTWLILFIAVPTIRIRIDDWLRHVWLEEAYVGRVLRREQIAEAFFKDPLHWRGLYLSRIERLRERFPLGAPSNAPKWQNPPVPAPDFKAQIAALRGPKRGYNIIVYYVDTLRNDVARDPAVMPNLARFAETSLDFRGAYATGSDTLRSLPALTGGNYDVSTTPENDFLQVAQRSGYDRMLLIAKSAHEFIGKLRPDFKFDRALDVPDYPAELQVWGYGAQQTTAKPLVDRAIEFLDSRTHAAKPFLLWLFNFDQHNWAGLDATYVAEMAQLHHIGGDPKQRAWRYNAVASGIDAEFGRLLKELERRKQMDNTIVLFVSDHGESLGRDGFWVHSVFLWDQLIRVPLVLHAPGLAPRRVEDRVSLVDVAPTLSPFMTDNAKTAGYQGEDLLGYLVPNRPARRLPLLLTAASKDVLVRVGLIDPARNWKVVLSLEAALPELYDLGSSDPDAESLADAHPALTLDLLRQLYHSPVFPRSADDFDVRDTKQQKAQYAAEAAAEQH